MDGQNPGLEVLTAIPATQEAPKSALDIAREAGDRKVESTLSGFKDFWSRAEKISKTALGLAVSSEARGALGQEVKGKVEDAIDGAAITVYAEVSRAEQQIKAEWSKGVESVNKAWNSTVETTKAKAAEVAVAGLKKAAAFGAEKVMPIVKGVVDVEGAVERVGFQVSADLLDALGRPISSVADRADNLLRTPHNIVEGAMDGIANRNFTEGVADRLKGTVDMLKNFRSKAREAVAFGFKLRSAAEEIRMAGGKRENQRDAVSQQIDTSTANMRAGNI